MKLYNKSSYPDKLLANLLVTAGKSVGARTTSVIVIATTTKAGYLHCKGTAWKCDAVRCFALAACAYKKKSGELKKGWVYTDGGYFKIIVPYPFLPDWVKQTETYKRGRLPHDGLLMAENIFAVAAHEWQHIKQYQTGKFDFQDRQERAKRHDNRIWERDAIRASNKVLINPKNNVHNSILELAVWIEDNK